MARTASANTRGQFSRPKQVGEVVVDDEHPGQGPNNDPATGVTYGEPHRLGGEAPSQSEPAPPTSGS